MAARGDDRSASMPGRRARLEPSADEPVGLRGRPSGYPSHDAMQSSWPHQPTPDSSPRGSDPPPRKRHEPSSSRGSRGAAARSSHLAARPRRDAALHEHPPGSSSSVHRTSTAARAVPTSLTISGERPSVLRPRIPSVRMHGPPPSSRANGAPQVLSSPQPPSLPALTPGPSPPPPPPPPPPLPPLPSHVHAEPIAIEVSDGEEPDSALLPQQAQRDSAPPSTAHAQLVYDDGQGSSKPDVGDESSDPLAGPTPVTMPVPGHKRKRSFGPANSSHGRQSGSWSDTSPLYTSDLPDAEARAPPHPLSSQESVHNNPHSPPTAQTKRKTFSIVTPVNEVPEPGMRRMTAHAQVTHVVSDDEEVPPDPNNKILSLSRNVNPPRDSKDTLLLGGNSNTKAPPKSKSSPKERSSHRVDISPNSNPTKDKGRASDEELTRSMGCGRVQLPLCQLSIPGIVTWEPTRIQPSLGQFSFLPGGAPRIEIGMYPLEPQEYWKVVPDDILSAEMSSGDQDYFALLLQLKVPSEPRETGAFVLKRYVPRMDLQKIQGQIIEVSAVFTANTSNEKRAYSQLLQVLPDVVYQAKGTFMIASDVSQFRARNAEMSRADRISKSLNVPSSAPLTAPWNDRKPSPFTDYDDVSKSVSSKARAPKQRPRPSGRSSHTRRKGEEPQQHSLDGWLADDSRVSSTDRTSRSRQAPEIQSQQESSMWLSDSPGGSDSDMENDVDIGMHQPQSIPASPPTRTPLPPEDDTAILQYPPDGGKGSVTLVKSDLLKLDAGTWLNDTVIDFALKYIHNQLEHDLDPTHRAAANQILVLTAFFYTQLTSAKTREAGYERVRKWTKNTDVFGKRYIVVPINERLHWYLAIIAKPERMLYATSPETAPPTWRQSEKRKRGTRLPNEDVTDEESIAGARTLSFPRSEEQERAENPGNHVTDTRLLSKDGQPASPTSPAARQHDTSMSNSSELTPLSEAGSFPKDERDPARTTNNPLQSASSQNEGESPAAGAHRSNSVPDLRARSLSVPSADSPPDSDGLSGDKNDADDEDSQCSSEAADIARPEEDPLPGDEFSRHASGFVRARTSIDNLSPTPMGNVTFSQNHTDTSPISNPHSVLTISSAAPHHPISTHSASSSPAQSPALSRGNTRGSLERYERQNSVLTPDHDRNRRILDFNQSRPLPVSVRAGQVDSAKLQKTKANTCHPLEIQDSNSEEESTYSLTRGSLSGGGPPPADRPAKTNNAGSRMTISQANATFRSMFNTVNHGRLSARIPTDEITPPRRLHLELQPQGQPRVRTSPAQRPETISRPLHRGASSSSSASDFSRRPAEEDAHSPMCRRGHGAPEPITIADNSAVGGAGDDHHLPGPHCYDAAPHSRSAAPRLSAKERAHATRQEQRQERVREALNQTAVPVVITFDSLRSKHGHVKVNRDLSSWLRFEAQHKAGREVNPRISCAYVDAFIPQQPNWWDCGIYVIHFFDRFASQPEEALQHLQSCDPSVAFWQAEEVQSKRAFWRELINGLSKPWIEQQEAKEQQRRADRQRRHQKLLPQGEDYTSSDSSGSSARASPNPVPYFVPEISALTAETTLAPPSHLAGNAPSPHDHEGDVSFLHPKSASTPGLPAGAGAAASKHELPSISQAVPQVDAAAATSANARRGPLEPTRPTRSTKDDAAWGQGGSAVEEEQVVWPKPPSAPSSSPDADARFDVSRSSVPMSDDDCQLISQPEGTAGHL